MIWTTEKPTMPGVYLWRAGKGCGYKTVILEYRGATTAGVPELIVTYPVSQTTAVHTVRFMGGEWAGPILDKEKEDEMDC